MASFHDVAKSPVTEIAGVKQAGSLGGHASSAKVDDDNHPDSQGRGMDVSEAGVSLGENRRKPMPNQPDPQEVQYPGYFKDGGSL